MKREKTLILSALTVLLFVQVFNTASLYLGFTNLSSPFDLIGSGFIGLGAEFGVFICIYCGSRQAGIVFAIISLFCGLLFHNDFTYLEQIDFWTQKRFLSSTLMQLMNSALVFYLSELYVYKIGRTKGQQDIISLKDEKEKLEQELITLRQDIIPLQNQRSDLLYVIGLMIEEKNKYEQDITTLKKKKAGMSRPTTEINEH